MVSSSPIRSASRNDPAERLRAHDWAATPFGPPETWPPYLRFAFDICLHSALPTAIYWGPDRLLIHNEPWRVLTGGGDMLGRPAPEAHGSLWPVIAPVADQVDASGEGMFLREQPLALVRDGEEQETYWNCSLLPILDQKGGVAGILNQANDVTKTVTVERRLSFQVMLADRLRGLSDPE